MALLKKIYNLAAEATQMQRTEKKNWIEKRVEGELIRRFPV
jgi:2-oxoglutarate dehydrogenase complex dehydrogenase (E1) component-like enzyme